MTQVTEEVGALGNALWMDGCAFHEAARGFTSSTELETRAVRVLQLLERTLPRMAAVPDAAACAFFGGAGQDLPRYLLVLRDAGPELLERTFTAMQPLTPDTRRKPLPAPLLARLLATTNPREQPGSQLDCFDPEVLAPLAGEVTRELEGSRERMDAMTLLTGVHVMAWLDEVTYVLAQHRRLDELRTIAAQQAVVTCSRWPLVHAALALAKSRAHPEARELLELADTFGAPASDLDRCLRAEVLRRIGEEARAEEALRGVLQQRWVSERIHQVALRELKDLLEEQGRKDELRALREEAARWRERVDQQFERFERSPHRMAYREEERQVPQPLRPLRAGPSRGRNERCACGSGRKVKRCCGV
ncbi:MAG: hypothetical protein QM767_24815 [Anaeromyxobacter sp.]